MSRPGTFLEPHRRHAGAQAQRGRSAWSAAVAGSLCGLLASLSWFAPASWLAWTVQSASGGQVLLASPMGTVWNGSARLEFSGGSGSQDATALPGRVSWALRPVWAGVQADVHAPCCTPQGLTLTTLMQWGGARLNVADRQSQWPAALLAGLGTPWNTMKPEGDLQLTSRGLGFEVAEGRVSVVGNATLEARHMSSRLSTLRPMGSYRFDVKGGGAGGITALQLDTLDGSLILNGSGQWAGSRLRFNGVATAAPDREAALSNLLNIIGRRDGVRSIITVG